MIAPSAAGAAGDGRTVDAAIDGGKLSGFQMAALFMCALVLFLDGFDIQAMSLVVTPLTQEWDLARENFSGVLSAANFGILFSAPLIGPVGDHIGRKPVTLCALLVVAISTLAATTATNVEMLTFWRFLTGLGLGTGMPNAYALATEIAPERLRSAVIVGTGSGVAAGGMTAGFTAPWLMQLGGDWRMVFYVGGVLPLIVCAVFFFALPESPRLLAVRKRGDPRIARFFERAQLDEPQSLIPPDRSVAPKAPVVTVSGHGFLDAAASIAGQCRRRFVSATAPVAGLFRREYRGATLLLWGSYSMVAFVLYLLIGWLPALLDGVGWPLAAAQRGAVLIQLGGIIGGIAYALYVRKGKPHHALIAAMALATISITMFWFTPPTYLVWSLVLTALGAGVGGALFALMAVAGGVYPPAMRATGLSYMIGVSRVAAAVSPLVGGALLALGFETMTVLSLLIVPITLAALSALLLPRVMLQQ